MMGNTMTVVRRQRKLQFWRLGTGLLFAWVLAAALGGTGQSEAVTADRVVVDRNSGLAINGFDPVAYFTDAAALPGKGEFEQEVAGVVWRFRNAGNRAAFTADPEIYRPRFGGYDPVGIARGVAVAGNPLLWAISDQRLFFFYTNETRHQFASDRDAIISTADREWPSVLRTVVP
jgi:hypothetical protein